MYEIVLLAIVALNTAIICDLWYWFRFKDVPAIVVHCPVAGDFERLSEESDEDTDQKWMH